MNKEDSKITFDQKKYSEALRNLKTIESEIRPFITTEKQTRIDSSDDWKYIGSGSFSDLS